MLDFATALREVGGVDADLDLWHQHQQWTTYGSQAIEASEFTLVVVSAKYKERWDGTGSPKEGAGAAREAAVIKSIYEKDRDEFIRRVKVVVLPGASIDDIPSELLGSAERAIIDDFDESGLEQLLRWLHDATPYVKPPLGDVPALPPRFVDGVSQAVAAASTGSEEQFRESEGDSDSTVDTLRRRIEQLERELASSGASQEVSDETALHSERDAVSASLGALERSGEKAAGRKPSVFLQRELDRAIQMRNGIRPTFAAGMSFGPSTTEQDVAMWTKRVQRVLSDLDPEILAEFNYRTLPDVMAKIFGGTSFGEPTFKKPFDQRIANLKNIIIELQERGR